MLRWEIHTEESGLYKYKTRAVLLANGGAICYGEIEYHDYEKMGPIKQAKELAVSQLMGAPSAFSVSRDTLSKHEHETTSSCPLTSTGPVS